MLPKSKAQKVSQITQNITSLLPNALPSLDQIILSLPMHRKTGSSDVIDTLPCLGHGISYSEQIAISTGNPIDPSKVLKLLDNTAWRKSEPPMLTLNQEETDIIELEESSKYSRSWVISPVHRPQRTSMK